MIHQLDLFVAGLELLVTMQGPGGGGDIGKPVIDEREVVVHQREVGFDLRGSLVMQTSEGKIAGVIVKVGQIVMGFDVARVVFQGLGKVVERSDKIAAIQLDDPQVAVSLGDVVAFINGFGINSRAFMSPCSCSRSASSNGVSRRATWPPTGRNKLSCPCSSASKFPKLQT